MPIRTELWKVGAKPQPVAESILLSEQLLEEMIVAEPRMLSDEWMLIGRQADTGHGGRIDLLAMAPDGSLVLIELKRERTPRDVVAQALDYASWVQTLQSEQLAALYSRFAPGRSLAEDFRVRFKLPLDEEALNQSHQIIIVAASLDASTERIVAYLSARNIPINVLCFQVFASGEEQLLSRSWLLDPIETQTNAATPADSPKEPWNGEFYCSFGQEGHTRSWLDAVELGFVSAGGGSWYSKTLKSLSPGDRIWVKDPGVGFLGVGLVMGTSQPAAEFTVSLQGRDVPILEAVKNGTYCRNEVDDLERCEYFVPVKWLATVPVEQAVREVGMFGNQNTVCRPTSAKWRWTVERLKERFPGYARSE